MEIATWKIAALTGLFGLNLLLNLAALAKNEFPVTEAPTRKTRVIIVVISTAILYSLWT